jgi:hypothetical protein
VDWSYDEDYTKDTMLGAPRNESKRGSGSE